MAFGRKWPRPRSDPPARATGKLAIEVLATERLRLRRLVLDDAPFILMTTLNLVRGMGINSMWQRNVSYYRKLLREWVTLVESGALEGRHCDLR